MNKIIFLILVSNISLASTMTFTGQSILKFNFVKEKNNYEVVIKNKAAFYHAEQSLLKCLEKGLKAKVDLEVDAMKLEIKSCK